MKKIAHPITPFKLLFSCLLAYGLSGCGQMQQTTTTSPSAETAQHLDHDAAALTTAQKPVTKEMSQAALLKLLNNEMSGYTLLDVRTPAEFADGHIQGAVNMSHDQILRNLSLLDKYKATTLIVYCRSGRRARTVTDFLEQQSGFQPLYHLEGDILGWKKAKLPLVTSE